MEIIESIKLVIKYDFTNSIPGFTINQSVKA